MHRLAAYRVVVGPSQPDRVIALDVIATNTVGLILVLDIRSGSRVYVDAALVIALLSFLGTVSLAKYRAGGRSLIAVIVSVPLLFGLVFTFAGSLGLLRLPDIFCRMPATGKSSTLGVISIVPASFVYFSASEAGPSSKSF